MSSRAERTEGTRQSVIPSGADGRHATKCHPERSERSERSRRIPCAPNGSRTAAGTPTMRHAQIHPRRVTRNEPAPRPRLCIRRHSARQTVHLATTRGRFGPLVVAACTVWAAGCRRMHSLGGNLSPGRQSGHLPVAGTPVWLARASKLDGWRQQGPVFASFLSPGRQSGLRRVAAWR